MNATRRQLIKQGALLAGGAVLAGASPLAASPMGQPLGFQTFEIIQHLNEDWHGTWNKMGSYGYQIADLVQFRSSPQLKDKTAKQFCRHCRRRGLPAPTDISATTLGSRRTARVCSTPMI